MTDTIEYGCDLKLVRKLHVTKAKEVEKDTHSTYRNYYGTGMAYKIQKSLS